MGDFDPFPKYWWLRLILLGAAGAVVIWAVGKVLWRLML